MDFLKWPFMQRVTQLEVKENILQGLKSESVPCIKLKSLKRKSHLWITETIIVLNESHAISCWSQYETFANCLPTC